MKQTKTDPAFWEIPSTLSPRILSRFYRARFFTLPMFLISFNRKNILIITLASLLALSLILVGVFVYQRWQSNKKPAEQNLPTPTPTISPQATTTEGMKIYRNEEWGFEFQYPQDWTVEENDFFNYYSKFNLKAAPINEMHSRFPFIINIVSPEFIKSFNGIEKTISDIIVDGVRGIKYEYDLEASKEIAVILPLGDFQMIIGTDNSELYSNIFNQILASFKFLKQEGN